MSLVDDQVVNGEPSTVIAQVLDTTGNFVENTLVSISPVVMIREPENDPVSVSSQSKRFQIGPSRWSVPGFNSPLEDLVVRCSGWIIRQGDETALHFAVHRRERPLASARPTSRIAERVATCTYHRELPLDGFWTANGQQPMLRRTTTSSSLWRFLPEVTFSLPNTQSQFSFALSRQP